MAPITRTSAPSAATFAGSIARAAWDHLGRVAPENQHWRFARHARHLTVDEFIREEIANDREFGARG